jgi:IS605 OrfB family transposase
VQQVLTVKIKLTPTPEQEVALRATLVAFANACNHIHAAVPGNIRNSARIQQLTYRDVREKFGLSANLAVRAIARVSMNRKAAKELGAKVKGFKPTSVDYDARIFDLRLRDETVSLTTVKGHLRVDLRLSNYHLQKLQGARLTSATLVDSKGKMWLHVQVKRDVPPTAEPQEVIGVDLGRTDIAVTSTGKSWSGKAVTKVRDRFAKTRQMVQKNCSKGTRSTRRRAGQLLQRLSGKEQRFQKHVNHVVSKAIVSEAQVLSAAIALEDLTGIRERTNTQPRSSTERRRSNSWAFHQLRGFVEYKAALAGVQVIPINPAYTSQTCHCCKHIGKRQGKRFECGNCGHVGDADHNGAQVIRLVGLTVTRPRGSGVLSCAFRASESP